MSCAPTAALALAFAASLAAPGWAAVQVGEGSAAAQHAPELPPGAPGLSAVTVGVLAFAACLAVAALVRGRWFRWQPGVAPRWPVAPSLSAVGFATTFIVSAFAVQLVAAPAESGALAATVVGGTVVSTAQLAWMGALLWYAHAHLHAARVLHHAAPVEGSGPVVAGTHTRTPGALAPPQAIALTAVVNLLGWPVLLVVSMIAARIEAHWSGEAPRLGHATLQAMSDAGTASVWWWGATALVVVLVPVAEELLYRGFLQQGLRRAHIGRGVSIAMTAAIFALLHWGALPEGARATGLVTLFVFGAMLGYLYERTGRLSMCIATHALFNAVNLARL